MWDEILVDLGLDDVPLIEELNFPEALNMQEFVIDILPVDNEVSDMEVGDSEVGGAEVDDFEIDDSEEMNLENLLNTVDMNELLEFEDINVEEVINTYNAGNMDEEDYRYEFFNREEVRVQMEPLVREMCCLTPWNPRPCGCIYVIDIFGNNYFLPSWWKHFAIKQKQALEEAVYDAFLEFHARGAYHIGGEWCAFDRNRVLVTVRSENDFYKWTCE